ncbi:flavodoxin family protein [Lacisediminihabitans sp.]|uniref:flavodoxin family protein n=1 Tax=Lacisediminihabitans sp. TaxID=2787631 RepID=UPI00374DB156
MTRVAVAYHSGYGHTAVLAEAARRGAESAGAEATLVDVDSLDDTAWAALDAADAIVFGAPTYMGGASAGFHAFAEASSSRYSRARWADKIAGGFTNSGSKSGDKSNTLAFLSAFAFQHRMVWVGLGLAPAWNSTTSPEHSLNRLGYWSGAGAQTPIDGTAEHVHSADIDTVEHLGARIARAASIAVAGRSALGLVAAYSENATVAA